MALTNPCFKDQVGLMFWGEEEPYGRRGRGRREEKMEEPRSRPKRYGTWIFGMETELKYGFMEF